MKHDYMNMECQGKGPGTSRNRKVKDNLHMVLVEMIGKLKVNFMSLRLVFDNVDNVDV